MGSLPVLHQAATDTDWNWQAVAVCERLAAVILLLLALPLLAVCALALWLLSGRTPVIAHRRVGWQGTPLWMLKLRTMWGGEARRRAGWIEYIEDDRGPELKSGGFAGFLPLGTLLPAPFHRRQPFVILNPTASGGSIAVGVLQLESPCIARRFILKLEDASDENLEKVDASVEVDQQDGNRRCWTLDCSEASSPPRILARRLL